MQGPASFAPIRMTLGVRDQAESAFEWNDHTSAQMRSRRHGIEYNAARPGECRAAYVQNVSHVLAGFALVDQLSGVVDLFEDKLRPPAKLYAATLSCFYPGAGAFRNEATFQFGHTPVICHMALPVGVAVSIASVSEWNFTPPAQRSSSIVIMSRTSWSRRSSFHTIGGSPARSDFQQRERQFYAGSRKP